MNDLAITPSAIDGIAWTDVGTPPMSKFIDNGLNFSYYHAWTPVSPDQWGGKLHGIPHMPCSYAYRPEDPNVDFWEALDQGVPDDYSGDLLVLNEPDRPGQCMMDYYEAYSFYIELSQRRPLARLSLPGVSQTGLSTWLTGFLSEYAEVMQLNGVNVGSASVHCYELSYSQTYSYLRYYRSLLDGYGYGRVRYDGVLQDIRFIVSEWGASSLGKVKGMYKVIKSEYRNMYFTVYHPHHSNLSLFRPDYSGLAEPGIALRQARNGDFGGME